MIVVVFILKLVAITYFVDAWLYWLHRAFHAKRTPVWFKRFHMQHHADFQRSEIFSLHPVEFLLNITAPFLFTWWIIGAWFFPFVVGWGVFEAARGHGHFRWLKIPKAYYKFFDFCGIRYHLVHHAPGGESVNLGQVLRTWDRLCGTGQVSGTS